MALHTYVFSFVLFCDKCSVGEYMALGSPYRRCLSADRTRTLVGDRNECFVFVLLLQLERATLDTLKK